jgi:hypothetical protein
MKTIQINKPLLHNLYGDSIDCIEEVFSEFLSTHGQIRENLTSSYHSGKIDSLRKFLHHHGPSFLYLGLPSISDFFKNLELQCKLVSDKSAISSEFSILMQMVDESRIQVINQLAYIKQTA